MQAIFQTVLIVTHLMIVLALVGVVLIQRSEGGGLGIGGGSGFMSARGTANTLTRTTAILATLFFLTSIGLSIVARSGTGHSIIDRIPATSGQGSGILDSLGGAQAPANQPAGNGVPSSGAATPAPAPAAQAPATTAPAATAPTTAPAATAPATPATPAAPAPAQPSGVPTGQ